VDLDSASLRIEVAGMGKKMLSLTVNAAAEKIIARSCNAGRGRPLPGHSRRLEATHRPQPRSSAPLAGSIQEAALSNPGSRGHRISSRLEVRSVVDLRQK